MPISLEPVLLSCIAGLSTGIGGLIVIALGKVSDRAISLSMGFASGVMLLVAFNGLFFEATKILNHLELILAFSLGALLMMVLDLALPHIELTSRKDFNEKKRTLNTGALIAVGITLHNLPEGFIIAAGFGAVPSLGLIIAISIMLHNIPEGLATAIPLKASGMKPLRVAIVAFLSGLAEPIGAFIGVLTLSTVNSSGIFIGSSLAIAAGIMTYITADELIPVAHEYGFKHTVSVGLLIGIIFALLVDLIIS